MALFPKVGLGFLNGWLPLVLFYAPFGLYLALVPRTVVTRLYNRTGWSEIQRVRSAVGKIVVFAWLSLVVFTPLTFGTLFFGLGTFLYWVGLVGFLVALLNYKDTPLDQPVTKGIYRVSRNPQQLSIFVAFFGISLMIGSWTATLLITAGAIMAHVRVLAEEKACLERYGSSYSQYMEEVPRYLIFF